MAYSEAQKRATIKYKAKTYDRLELQLKKAQKTNTAPKRQNEA